MNIQGTRTEEMLKRSFLRELQARAYYSYYARVARDNGLTGVADIFEATADNEAEHAMYEFNYLGGAADTASNLSNSIKREFEEAQKLYPEAAAVAREEGFVEIADFFARMAKVEERHGTNMQALVDSIKQPSPVAGRTVSHSAIQMCQTMLPNQTNPVGLVHGGELMKLIDNAAAAVALRHSQNFVVTAEVDNIVFKSPVRVGELVNVDARLTFTSRSSMEIKIIATGENMLTGEKHLVVTAYYVFVPVDATGKTLEVPPLIISTEEEARLFAEGQARYNARKQRK
jgi:acyl-CoA hydrolase/ferritin